MSLKLRRFLKCMLFPALTILQPVNAQMLQDSACLKLLKKNIDYTYNLQFREADEVFSQIKSLYPEHPIVYLLKGIITYWKNYPLVQANPPHVSFETDMRQCIKLCESAHDTVYESEYLLANLCARGMLLMYYADNDLSFELVPLASGTYKYIRNSFDYNTSSIDLNYFTGLYNYYREAYPAAHPIYKSFSFMFPSGDLENGIKQLQRSAQNAVFLRADSYFSLAWIYLYYEDKYPESLYYCKTLHELYPDNSEYHAMYIKNLLLMKRYDEAEIQIKVSEKKAKEYYLAQITIFKGILYEKKYKDNKTAQEFYNKSIPEFNSYGGYGNEYASYAYYGLSRISVANGEKQAGRIYRNMAEKLSDFKEINFDK
jgi:hypothetical protein